MSLINEALKKAQRQRTDDPTPAMSAAGGSAAGRAAKRGQPFSGSLMLLIGSGAVVLVVVTVVITFYVGNRPAPTAPTANLSASQAPAKPLEPSVTTPLAPPVMAPVPKPTPAVDSTPAPVKEPVPAIVSSNSAPAPSPASTAAKIETPSPVISPASVPATEVTTAPSKPSPPAAEPAKTDERIHTFLDNVRIAGVRTSGNESRVLLNDRVFRINDLVDRALGIRLIKVEAKSLTFSDANGAIYVKSL